MAYRMITLDLVLAGIANGIQNDHNCFDVGWNTSVFFLEVK